MPLVSGLTPQRHLSLHEHYSLEMLSNYGVTVPHGELAYTPEQARQIAEKLGMPCFSVPTCMYHIHVMYDIELSAVEHVCEISAPTLHYC